MKTINLNEESILRAQAIGTLRIVLAVTAAGGRIQIEDEMGLIEYADSVSAAERRIADVLMKGGYFAHGFTYSGHPVAAAAAERLSRRESPSSRRRRRRRRRSGHRPSGSRGRRGPAGDR